jgi:lipopolysaccharide/colanic/teichoic acid biosynthesis glycosyltransferase
MSLYARGGKRAFDLVAAASALLLLSPVILALSLAIAAKLGRPVLFSQERTGWQRRPFRILKFRSMLNAVDEHGHSSLDELPALWNIIRGEMSLVGPRPFIHDYDSLYSREQARRFLVRPGITGWAQVNGRNALRWPQKFALDTWYVDHQSFWLDVKIIWATLLGVLRRHGINSADAATMPPFRGEIE